MSRTGRATLGIAVVALALVAWRTVVEFGVEFGVERGDAPNSAQKPRWSRTGYSHAARAVAALGGPLMPAPDVFADRVTFEPDTESSAVEPRASASALWHADEGATPLLAGLVNGYVAEVEHVRIERDALASLTLGALVPIELPNGERYLARVEHLVAHENGDRSWSGHLDGHGLAYPVTYTQGDVAVFGMLATPSGLYTLEAQGDVGVLFLDRRDGLQDADQACELLPD